MNAKVRLWGTWILSILFVVWIAVTWFASMPVMMIVMLSSTASPPLTVVLRFLVTIAVLWVLPPCLAVAGLHLWQKTRFPWFAIVPALIAIASIATFITYGRLFLIRWP